MSCARSDSEPRLEDETDPEKHPQEKPIQEPSYPSTGDAWLRVFATFLVYVSTWGLLNAIGSYQNYYQDVLLKNESPSNLAWIGTLQAVLIILLGVFSGPLFDKGFISSLLIVGSLLVVFGMMMTSLGTEYYQILLAQGLCVGLGSGIIYVPCLAMVGSSFPPRTRVLAIALATSGAAVGGIVFPVALQKLLPQVGFPWATRIIGFIALACFAAALAIVLPRAPAGSKKARSLVDWTAFREPAFMLFCFSLFFMFSAYYVPFFFIPEFAQVETGASVDFAVYLLVILNAATAPGRIMAALLAQRFGNMEVLLASTFTTMVLLWGWFGVHSLGGLIAWAVVFGVFAGPLVTLPAAVCAQVSPSLEQLGTRLGMAWAFAALGGLVGAPSSGALIQKHGFPHAQAFIAAMMTAGFALLFCLGALLKINARKAS